MPFIPHTHADIKQMLAKIGISAIDELFDEIPEELRTQLSQIIPHGITELEMEQLLDEKVKNIKNELCFIGAGAYEHHIPAVVWELANRGEFLTAYTPYQAEASQGTLQLLYEYQTMIASLTGMEIANASLYDGASALAEAILMAARIKARRKKQRILLPTSIHPHYRQAVKTIVSNNHIELIEIPFDQKHGICDINSLATFNQEEISAIVIQQPNFFGCYEEVDQVSTWAKQRDILVIACVNPTTLAVIKEPGKWGSSGADIVCGEGQPLGIPLNSGGPYLGFLATRQAYVRQIPGRIVGRTEDKSGNSGFTLTLQAREQHIRRSKATSNICTNQGLLVTAATIYMSLLGPQGLKKVALSCHHNNHQLIEKLTAIPGVKLRFEQEFFHEAVITMDQPINPILKNLAQLGIQGGYDMSDSYPELGNSLLVCATETKTAKDLSTYASVLSQILTEKLD